MTAMRSAMVMASSWSCVTITQVTPTLLMMLLQLELGLRAQLAVERAQRFVEQQQLRALGQAARQRHALLLAARELVRACAAT